MQMRDVVCSGGRRHEVMKTFERGVIVRRTGERAIVRGDDGRERAFKHASIRPVGSDWSTFTEGVRVAFLPVQDATGLRATGVYLLPSPE